jgi:hypothetical protein
LSKPSTSCRSCSTPPVSSAGEPAGGSTPLTRPKAPLGLPSHGAVTPEDGPNQGKRARASRSPARQARRRINTGVATHVVDAPRSLRTRRTVKDGVPRRSMETTEATSGILPAPEAEATNTRSAAGAMAATRRTQASSTRRFVQRAVSRLLEHDHAVAAKSEPGNPPEGE